jgi:hypothetical protein
VNHRDGEWKRAWHRLQQAEHGYKDAAAAALTVGRLVEWEQGEETLSGVVVDLGRGGKSVRLRSPDSRKEYWVGTLRIIKALSKRKRELES